jgi:hypothetical protein
MTFRSSFTFPNKSTVHHYKAGCRSLHRLGHGEGFIKSLLLFVLVCLWRFLPHGDSEALSFFFIPPLFITAYIIRSWSRRLQKQWPLWSKCIP